MNHSCMVMGIMVVMLLAGLLIVGHDELPVPMRLPLVAILLLLVSVLGLALLGFLTSPPQLHP